MEIGLYGVCTDQTLRPDVMAKLVEDAGFDALAIGEHTHIPASRDSPYPGGDLPEDYVRTYDLFIALHTAAAGHDPAAALARRSSRSPSATRS